MTLSPYVRPLRRQVGTTRLLLPSVSGHVFDDRRRLLLVHAEASELPLAAWLTRLPPQVYTQSQPGRFEAPTWTSPSAGNQRSDRPDGVREQ